MAQKKPSAYKFDLSKGEDRGIGLRYEHSPSGRYLDIRLEGYPKSAGNKQGRSVSFAPKTGMEVIYEPRESAVKETIILQHPPLTNIFTFKINAKGLFPRDEDGEILFGAEDHPQHFRLEKATAFDAFGSELPANLSLSKDKSRVLLELDADRMAAARYPVTIDPTVIAGDALTGGSHARRLFETSDNKLIFFYRETDSMGTSGSLLYKKSDDDGQSWSAPTKLADISGWGEQAVHQASGDKFYMAYSNATNDSVWIGFRAIYPSGGAWTAGPESRVSTGGATFFPSPNIVHLGGGPLGERLAISFSRIDSLFSYYQTVVSISEDSGANWGIATTCDIKMGGGTVAAQGERLVCITDDPWGGAFWREWTGIAWSLPKSLGLEAAGGVSSVTSAGGVLHAVAGSNPVKYASLQPGAVDWEAPVSLGVGSFPVISLLNESLQVFAHEELSGQESQILSYVSADGTSWRAGTPFSGSTFLKVFDYNQTWKFQDGSGDALFGLTHTQGTFGNFIGTTSEFHRLDSPTEKLSFAFVPDTEGPVTSIKLWLNAKDGPTYRIGLQSDSAQDLETTPSPSGTWLGEKQVGGVIVSGAFSDENVATTSSLTSLEATFAETILKAGTRYHVVVEPVKDITGLSKPAGPNNWIEVQAVGADVAGIGNFAVLDGAGSPAVWTVAALQVPRLVIGSAANNLMTQDIQPWGPSAVSEYSIVGESFAVDSNIIPTKARFYLRKVGTPSGDITVRLLDEFGKELWSAPLTPSPGWAELLMNGVSLISGSRVRLVLDHSNRDLSNQWRLGVSNGATTSWRGALAKLTTAPDRSGFNDRTEEASKTANVASDFVAFNSGTSDALYLGGAAPFDWTTLVRAGGSITTLTAAWQYWNGQSWSALSMKYNTFGGGYREGVSFDPPTDWYSSLIEGQRAYWVKVTNSTENTSLPISRLTSIRNFSSPTAAPTGKDFVPLAFTDGSQTQSTTVFKPYVDGPTYCATCVAKPDCLGGSMEGSSVNPSVSGDGRFVAFESTAGFSPSVVCDDFNGWSDIYLYDRLARSFRRISVPWALAGIATANGPSTNPSLSTDGSFVSFESVATDLTIGADGNGLRDVFLSSLIPAQTSLISATSNGAAGNGWSGNSSVSAGGAFVAFESDASNLVAGDTSGQRDVFVRNVATKTTVRVSAPTQGQSNGWSGNASISPDGRYVAFSSDATNLVSGDTNGVRDVFLKDLALGTLTRVSVGQQAIQSNGASDFPSVSPEGPKVAFSSGATNLVGNADTNGLTDVFYRDLNPLPSVTGTGMVSTDPGFFAANGWSGMPAVSADGNFVAFESDASDLVAGDLNGAKDVFVKGLMTGKTVRASVSSDGSEARAGPSVASAAPSITSTGAYTAFNTAAYLSSGPILAGVPLTSQDQDAYQDIYVRENDTSVCLGRSRFAYNCADWSLATAYSDDTGLEDFYPYRAFDVGAGTAYVNASSRKLSLQFTDIDLPGPGLNMRLVRTYNSRQFSKLGEGVPPLGKNWTFAVGLSDGEASDGVSSRYLIEASEDHLDLDDGDGTNHRFVKGGAHGPGWHSPPGVSLKISDGLDAAGKWYRATRPDGVVYEIRLVGIAFALKKIYDRIGNELTYVYETQGTKTKLKSVTDSSNRTFSFVWVGDLVDKVILTTGSQTIEVDYSVSMVGDNDSQLDSVTQFSGTVSARTMSYKYGSACGVSCKL